MLNLDSLPTITSLTNEKVKLLASLRLEKYRTAHGLFLVEGARMINDASRAGFVPNILAVRDDQKNQPDIQNYTSACDDVICVTSEVLAKITNRDNPQAVVAAYEIKRKSASQIKSNPNDMFIALDRVRDLGNLGTIIRTADAVGAAGVVLIGASCDAYAPETIRASTGSIFHVPVYEASEDEFVTLARTWPGSVVGTAASGNKEYRAATYQSPTLIVMGTEQSGMSAAIEGVCKSVVRIPIHGRAESLNLATAAALMLYAVREAC